MSKKKILAIDDEVNFLEVLKLSLESTDRYEVQVESDATQAMFRALQYQPDLVLLDIIMPKKEGPEVANEMKEDTLLQKIPIVFLTATVTQEEVEDSKGTIGGYPFIAKPSSLGVLMSTIEQNLAVV